MFEGITISGFADELDENLEKQIKGFQNLGITHIEIRGVGGKGLVEYTLDEVKKFKEQLDESGMKISSIGSPIGKIKITDDFEPHFELFKHTVEIAKIMETKYIRMFSFFIPEGEDPEQYTDEVMARLARFVEYAEEHDVILLHENEKDIYGDIASRCLRVMEKFYGDHFKAVFDFANFVQCGQDTMEAYEMLAPYIEYVHVKDALKENKNVVPAGMGDGNVKKILGILKEKNYNGFLSLEPHLASFTGFGALEQGKYAEKEKLDGKDVFDIAYNALNDILVTL